MRIIPAPAILFLGVVATVATWSGARPLAADSNVKLAGCLVKSSDSDAYLLTNSPTELGSVHADDTTVSPDGFGASGGFTSVFYWLDGDGVLKDHVGHRVEVQGDVQGDPKDGELKIDRKENWNELEVKADGRTLKANVPLTSVVADEGAKPNKREVIVRRVAEKVKMLSASCTP